LRIQRVALWVLAAVALLVAIDNLDRPLANPDEGRYSEISREMAATNNWVTPRLNGVKYFEKPPLQYWASAVSLKVFGDKEWSARLYVALAGLATLLITGFTAARVLGRDQGLASIAALLASPYFMALGGTVTLDMGLTLWTTVTLCAYLLAQAADDARLRRRWMLAAWAAMALAVLSKGLVGIVFPGAAIFLHCLVRRDFSPIARLQWGSGLAVFLVIAAPWFIAVSNANPEFARFFFVHEHFERFLTTSHRRTEPWWYFLPILAAGFLPWMFALPSAALHAWRSQARPEGGQPLRLALLFSAFVVLFFSASGSKLPAYILPAFPPLALVLGRYLAEAPTRRLALFAAPIVVVAIAGAFAAWQMPDRGRDAWTAALYLQARPWALAGAGVLLVVAVAAAWLLWHGKRHLAIAIVAIGSMLMVGFLEDAYEEMAPRQSGIVAADKARPLVTPQTRLYSVAIYDQTLPFYLGRTFTLVDYVDEFETGLKAQPGLHIAKRADFPAEWARPGDALAIMQPDIYRSLRTQGLPMQLVHEDPRRILVRKP